MQIAATFILPEYHQNIYFGGHGKHVIYFDLDCKFDVVRFAQIVFEKLVDAQQRARNEQHNATLLSHVSYAHTHHQGQQHNIANNNTKSTAAAAGDCLVDAETNTYDTEALIYLVQNTIMPRLHLVSCHNSFQLVAALSVSKPLISNILKKGTDTNNQQPDAAAALHAKKTAHVKTLKNPTIHAAAETAETVGAAQHRSECLGAILLDNASAFYYADRSNKDDTPLSVHRVHSAMMAGLKRIQHAYRVPIITTRHVLSALGMLNNAWMDI